MDNLIAESFRKDFDPPTELHKLIHWVLNSIQTVGILATRGTPFGRVSDTYSALTHLQIMIIGLERLPTAIARSKLLPDVIQIDAIAAAQHLWKLLQPGGLDCIGTLAQMRELMPPAEDHPNAVKYCDNAIAVAQRAMVQFKKSNAPDILARAAEVCEAKKLIATVAPTKITEDEANVKARDILRRNPTITARKLAAQIPCALGMISKLTAWKAVQGYKPTNRAGKNPKTPKTVRLSDKLLAATPATDNGELSRLIREQADDAKSDDGRRRIRAGR